MELSSITLYYLLIAGFSVEGKIYEWDEHDSIFWSKELSRRSPLGIAGEVFSALPPIFKLLVVLLIVNAFLIAAIGSTQLKVFRNTAIIKSIEVGVYEDANCSYPVEGIDWGIIEPGENKTEIVYMRNEGNWEFHLSVYAVNWAPPETESYMNVTSDYQGQPIPVGSTVRVELVLSLSEDVRDITSFNFDLVIEVEG